MHILFLNGNEFRGNWRELTRALWHPLFIGLTLGVIGIIVVIQPYNHILPHGVISRTLIVASATVVFFGVVLFALSHLARSKRRTQALAVILPAVVISSVWGVSVSALAGGNGLSLIGWAQLIAFNFIFAICAEIFLASFLLRRIMAETGLDVPPFAGASPPLPEQVQEERRPLAEAATIKVTPPQYMDVLGKPVTVNSLWHMKAEEHYVSLTFSDGTSVLRRGRLADAIAQIPAELGLQVHRSHWIAASALAALDRKRAGWRLQLRNGTDIPVARNRQSDVRDWVEKALKTG